MLTLIVGATLIGGGSALAPSALSRRSLLAAAGSSSLVVPGVAMGDPSTLAMDTSVTDESVTVFEDSVGIELEVTRFARVTLGALPSTRVAVRRIIAGSAAEGKLNVGDILVSANGESLEARPLEDVAAAIGSAKRPLTLVTRDPRAFTRSLEPGGDERASTSVLSDYGGERQILAVERLKSPRQCAQGAKLGDLLEVRYEGRLEDGTLFDGSAITFGGGNSVAGRGGDSSLYFVLGQQPRGQFPTAFDPAMAGACVTEIRRVRVPPVIGFQDKGSPRRGVPPYATLYYTLELLSVNGVALPPL